MLEVDGRFFVLLMSNGILIGLMGAVVGAWIASGEPLGSLAHYRRTDRWTTAGDVRRTTI